MATIVKKKGAQGRWHILVMRSQGVVTNLAVSPLALLLAFLFALVFIAAAVLVGHRYFNLYWDHRELAAEHQEVLAKLHRLESLYAYQSTVANEYANLLNTGQRPDEADALPDAEPVPADSGQAPAEAGTPAGDSGGTFSPEAGPVAEPASPLDVWGGLFSDLPAEQPLNIDRLEVSGPSFRFHLTNEVAGTQAQGHLLILFAVESGDRIVLIPFPDFNFRIPNPDFTRGPAYNIRSSKPLAGRLDMPPGGRIVEMMAVAKSRDGQVVMKRVVRPKS